MKHRFLLYIKILIYCIGFWFFIVNHEHLSWISARIRRDIIRPYQAQYEVVYTTPMPSQPIPKISESTPVLQPSALPTKKTTVVYITTTPVHAHISEEDLWNALTEYRKTHDKSSVNRSESLCVYARKRAAELDARLQTSPDEPLDAHVGFQRDADSGYVFEVTGYNYVGENLAFTPGYTEAIQIIEWGWDSSPGHRSLQLSEEITNGCIASNHPIYVGIYSY